MVDPIKHTVDYFKPYKDYFWNWADNGEVIEWINGTTICYRDDLASILDQFTSQGFPPLGAILLVIAACHDNFVQSGGADILSEVTRMAKNYGNREDDEEALRKHLREALNFMNNIAGLPKELRSGQQRILLLQEIFQPTTFIISDTSLKNLVEELNTGQLDSLIFTVPSFHIDSEEVKTDLQYLSKAGQKFPTTEKLALKLRTGLENIPAAVENFITAASPTDLFEELAKERKTEGLARLAKRLIAALNIPLHSQNSGDQSYGGITDITNRGNYDKLLLSELAHDELLLTARLVNNEALYFKREEPPDNPKRQRTILLDTSIRMWGLPRIFALSAALACAHNTKHNELVEAYALGGSQYHEMDLSTREGIIKALERLDHSLHCGASLQAVLKESDALEQNEYFFITDARQLGNADFQFFFSSIKASLHFIITVGRDEELNFYSCHNGATKLLSRARFDLNDLLRYRGIPDHKDDTPTTIPAFIRQTVSPLDFLATRVSNDVKKMAYLGKESLLIVTENQRVLWFPTIDGGAKELLQVIEKGKYFFGFGDNCFYIFVIKSRHQTQNLYKVDYDTYEVETFTDIRCTDTNEIVFLKDRMVMPRLGQAFDYQTRAVLDTLKAAWIDKLVKKEQNNLSHPEPSLLTQFHHHHNYSILINIKTIRVSSSGNLVFGKHHLQIKGNNVLKLVDEAEKATGKSCREITDIKSMLSNKQVKFRKTVWADGSTAIIDGRGFIHLQSSNKAIPEISIALIVGRATACWSSDGYVCGAPFLIKEKANEIMHVNMFYKKYIQPFIDHLT